MFTNTARECRVSVKSRRRSRCSSSRLDRRAGRSGDRAAPGFPGWQR
ncbi:hypothetical protein [Nostoc sp.]